MMDKESQFFFDDRVFKLGRKILTIFKLKCSKFELLVDPLIIKDFISQNVIFCLPEGYSGVSNLPGSTLPLQELIIFIFSSTIYHVRFAFLLTRSIWMLSDVMIMRPQKWRCIMPTVRL